MKFDLYKYSHSYSEWENIIDEWIFNERDRKVLKRKLLDGLTYEKIAEEIDMSDREIRYIINSGLRVLICHI